MESLDVPFSLMFMAIGLLLAGLSIPLILGKVKPNPFYGFRTPKTMSSEAIWYPANRACGWGLLVGGLVTFMVSLLCLLLGGRGHGSSPEGPSSYP